ncbi:uncharacterized protein LOC135131677 [Zophobas morio]|uniref:uncharacterized protein LOC135131677 n=1 Tax=Zophobas morio TaxID=2755281 RepID=UPI003083EB43
MYPRKPKTHLCFEKYYCQIKIPFVIYAHFDSIQVPLNKTRSAILHKPCGFVYSVKCSYDDSLSKCEDYVGEDSPKVFWEKITKDAAEIAQKLRKEVQPKTLTDDEQNQFNTVEDCHFCHKKLTARRYQDFHPLTGDFLGAAHYKCRSMPKVLFDIPVVMHNLAKYGLHFLYENLDAAELKSVFRFGDCGFMRTFSNFKLRFIDSKRFMSDEKPEDLEKILKDVKKKRLKKEFKKKAVFDLMKKKWHFPFYHVDQFEKFQEEELPGKNGFKDHLRNETISADEYEKCLDIWDKFKCKTIGDYFRLYLKCKVFLLEDIFENFRDVFLNKYQLDAAHYFTVASFSWDAMLKYTGVELELLQDPNMISFIASNIRGGISQCSKRHVKANNVYCSNYDKKKKSSFIVYLDANNLGGWAMSQNLPISGFTWLSKTDIKTLQNTISSLDENGEFGYIFEVDLDYPQELHQLHNNLPFCSEVMSVPPPSANPKSTSEKKVLNFYHKRNYVIDYRTLKQCLQYGLELKKVHRVLKFKQSKWLQSYIDYNTKLRTKARNDFEIKLFKLLNNTIYGKSIQRSYNNKNSYNSTNHNISLDKPIYAGFTILELQKMFMYEFHYKHMVSKYGDKINLLYVDTDGFIYEIQTDDYFKDIKTDKKLLKLMDTSNFDAKWDIPKRNKKVVGKMKNEYGSKIIQEFLGVRAKVYFLDVEGEEVKKAASVKNENKLVNVIGRDIHRKRDKDSPQNLDRRIWFQQDGAPPHYGVNLKIFWIINLMEDVDQENGHLGLRI